MYLKEIIYERVRWTKLSQDRVQWQKTGIPNLRYFRRANSFVRSVVRYFDTYCQFKDAVRPRSVFY